MLHQLLSFNIEDFLSDVCRFQGVGAFLGNTYKCSIVRNISLSNLGC